MKGIFSNTNKISATLVLAALLFTSCKKLISIPPNPPSSITQQEAFADSASTISTIAGVYAYNTTGQGFAYSDGQLTFTSGLSSDELVSSLTGDIQQFYSYNLTSLNSRVSTLWAYPYKAIYQVNAVLSGVKGNGNLSPSFINQITGEMEVVRSLYYFNLINMFGDAPLVTSTDYNQTSNLPRSPVAAIYARVTTDLNDAMKKLKATYPSAGRARPNLYTAVALLAKVNLYRGNWQNAFNCADSVIRLGGYSLLPSASIKNVFLDGSTEAIWQLPANQSYYATSEAQYFIPTFSAPSYSVTPFLLKAFENGDLRLANWIGTKTINVGGTNQTFNYPYKYKNTTASTSPAEDYMLFRLAEMYLIRAEAAAHLNNPTQTLADINTIRARAGLTGSTANPASQTELLAAVMHERQVELFCEGAARWYDLKRTGTAAAVLNAVKTGYANNAALYPLPQSELILNKSLIQNPGY